MKSGRRLSIDQVYDILKQLIEILRKLHTHEPPVIHRDIKPSNILIKYMTESRFKVYLIDFGAVANPQVQSGGSTVAGTFGYMPPEQMMGNPQPASDIYALGAVAIQLFTGIAPTDLPQKDFHLIFEPQMQSYPVSVVNTLRSMIDPDPLKRFADHRKLYELFDAFKNNRYEATGSRQNRMSARSFDDQLKKVQYYSEPGCIELWQELTDYLPRQTSDIPASYLRLDKADRNPDGCYFDGAPIFKQTSQSYSDDMSIMPRLLAPVIVLVGGWLSFFICDLLRLPVGAVMLGNALSLGIEVFWVIYSKHRQRQVRYTMSLDSALATFDQEKVQELLTNGRKTVATIKHIQYVTAGDSMVETNLKASSTQANYCIHSSPTFRIDYQFNPPDDERKDDLVHCIYTHLEPENHYKVGDPFPILYRIYHKNKYGYNHEVVDSMPFPLPLQDVFSDANAFYHSA